MAPSLLCGGDQLKFRAMGPGASHFAVEQGRLSLLATLCQLYRAAMISLLFNQNKMVFNLDFFFSFLFFTKQRCQTVAGSSLNLKICCLFSLTKCWELLDLMNNLENHENNR